MSELSFYGFNRPSLSSKRDSFLFTSHITVFLKSCQDSLWLKERMTQSLDVQLHSWSLLSHLSNKGNFGARVLFKLCYIKARRNFFQTKEILEQECSLNFVTSKQGGNFQMKETLKYNGTMKLPSVSLGMSSVCLRHQELH